MAACHFHKHHDPDALFRQDISVSRHVFKIYNVETRSVQQGTSHPADNADQHRPVSRRPAGYKFTFSRYAYGGSFANAESQMASLRSDATLKMMYRLRSFLPLSRRQVIRLAHLVHFPDFVSRLLTYTQLSYSEARSKGSAPNT